MKYTDTQKAIMRELAKPDTYPVAVRLSGILCTKKNNLRALACRFKGKKYACVYFDQQKGYEHALTQGGLMEFFLNYVFLLSLYDDGYLFKAPAGTDGFRLITESQEKTKTLLSFTFNNNGYELGQNEFVDKDFCYFQIGNKMYEGRVFDENPDRAYEILSRGAFPSPKLQKLIKHNFRTDEENTLLWTRIAAAIAFVGMIVTIILSLIL